MKPNSNRLKLVYIGCCCLQLWLTMGLSSSYFVGLFVDGFQCKNVMLHSPQRQQRRQRPTVSTTIRRYRSSGGFPSALLAVQQQEQEEKMISSPTTVTSTQQQQQQEATRLREQARSMRLQAEQMDMSLTLHKIEVLERKLSNPTWMEKHSQQQIDDMKNQLQLLTAKLNNSNNYNKDNNDKELSSSSSSSLSSLSTPTTATSTTTAALSPPPQPKNDQSKSLPKHLPPKAGFDDDDLKLYVPVAEDIERMVQENDKKNNVTTSLREKVKLFQSAPELQQHFQEKITKLIMGPLEQLQQMESLKADYLNSNSKAERQVIKQKITRLEEELQSNGSVSSEQDEIMVDGVGLIGYRNSKSNSIKCRAENLPPLTEVDLEERYQTIKALPDILIAIYKQRTGLYNVHKDEEEEDITRNLRLAIQLDYYDIQLQLLEQARSIQPFTDESRTEFIQAYESLPPPVRRHFASTLGLTSPSKDDVSDEVSDNDVDYYDAQQVLEEVLKRESPLSPILQVVEKGESMADPPEYNDIEFVDRSRFLEEFFPSIGNMEGNHPDQESVDLFVTDCLSKSKAFMVTSKPERVVGGYYIRGQNQLNDSINDTNKNGNGGTASERLVQEVSQRLQNHPTLANKLDFFYILDPSPPTDEEMELGEDLSPIFVVTTKDPSKMYSASSPLTKSLVSLSGLASTLFLSIGACVLNPSISDRLFDSLDAATETGTLDIQWFLELCLPLYFSILGILTVHEVGHRIVAAIYKFDVGLPNIVPSITQGVAGTITPLKSPPPNNKALFDFAIAGPLAGLISSIALLYGGMELTQTMSLDSNLPVLPVDFVRASSLGGGMAEYFLGKVAVLPNQGPNAFVELHPFAIAGFIGCLVNALAMLPLGHTDGGRISLAMFGRRGAFVTKLFTTLLLAVAGLFGLDDNYILLAYVLYTLIWQRELETPIRNEVDEVDFARGFLGIIGAMLVGLVLIPMI